MKLQNYDLVVIGNVCYKFLPDRTHGLGAGIIYFLEPSFFLDDSNAVPILFGPPFDLNLIFF